MKQNKKYNSGRIPNLLKGLRMRTDFLLERDYVTTEGNSPAYANLVGFARHF